MQNIGVPYTINPRLLFCHSKINEKKTIYTQHLQIRYLNINSSYILGKTKLR